MMVYHERQSKQLCALHVLNNLLQDENAFSKAKLDAICLQLAPNSSRWWNPHRSPFGWGNYDVNVMMTALQNKQFDCLWFDKRKDVTHIRPSAVVGFILNVPSASRLASWLPSSIAAQKHWIAVRQVDGVYYNLDSNLAMPECIGEANALLEFLQRELSQQQRELLLVVEQTTSKEQLWKSS